VAIPFIQKKRIGAYLIGQLLMKRARFPLVLMLEPTFRCNLQCSGCGKISRPGEVLDRRLSIEDCIDAVAQCPSPVVSIPGGEPLLLGDMPEIVSALVSRKKFIYLCTNGLLVEKRIEDFTPSPFLTFNIHVDGLRDRHDTLSGRTGVFDKAVSAIGLLRSKGFRVTTNTTLYRGETPERAVRLFDFLTSLGVEGMTVAPAFGYEKASSDPSAFLSRSEAADLFDRIFRIGGEKRWPFNHSSRYLQFLAGHRSFRCTPWGTPTRNVFGWQRPCYLIEDGFAKTFRELMETTDWQAYGAGRDPRCTDCMVHCGHEPSAVLDSLIHPFAGRTFDSMPARRKTA